MIEDFAAVPACNSISLSWAHPTVLPSKYELDYECAFLGSNEFRSNQRGVQTLDPSHISAKITDVIPGSACTIKFIAVYDGGRVDSSVTHEVKTSCSSEFLRFDVITLTTK